jgi:hypothetical protein
LLVIPKQIVLLAVSEITLVIARLQKLLLVDLKVVLRSYSQIKKRRKLSYADFTTVAVSFEK